MMIISKKPDGKRSWSYFITIDCFIRICNYSRHAKRQAVSKEWLKLVKKHRKSGEGDKRDEQDEYSPINEEYIDDIEEDSNESEDIERGEDSPKWTNSSNSSNCSTEVEQDSGEGEESEEKDQIEPQEQIQIQVAPAPKVEEYIQQPQPQPQPQPPVRQQFTIPPNFPNDWSYLKLVPMGQNYQAQYPPQIFPQFYQMQLLLKQQQYTLRQMSTNQPYQNQYPNSYFANCNTNNVPQQANYFVSPTMHRARAMYPYPSYQSNNENDVMNDQEINFDTDVFLSIPDEYQCSA